MLGTSLLWRSTVAFTYLIIKSAKCLCLLPVVLVLLFWSCLGLGLVSSGLGLSLGLVTLVLVLRIWSCLYHWSCLSRIINVFNSPAIFLLFQLDRTTLYNTIQYNTIQYNTIQWVNVNVRPPPSYSTLSRRCYDLLQYGLMNNSVLSWLKKLAADVSRRSGGMKTKHENI